VATTGYLITLFVVDWQLAVFCLACCRWWRRW
jgi:hypothetical protein